LGHTSAVTCTGELTSDNTSCLSVIYETGGALK
jgi:hypothetical protein